MAQAWAGTGYSSNISFGVGSASNYVSDEGTEHTTRHASAKRRTKRHTDPNASLWAKWRMAAQQMSTNIGNLGRWGTTP